MKGERRKKQDNEQKAGNEENIGIAYGQKRTEDKRERETEGRCCCWCCVVAAAAGAGAV